MIVSDCSLACLANLETRLTWVRAAVRPRHDTKQLALDMDAGESDVARMSKNVLDVLYRMCPLAGH